MFLSDEVNEPVVLHSDVLIIGSGPIGAVYARSLFDADNDINILMVDIGEQGTRLIGDHKKNSIVVQKATSQFTSTVRGGLSLLSEPAIAETASLVPISLSSSDREFVFNNENVNQLPHENLSLASAVREVGGMGSYWICSTPKQHPEIERSDIFSDEEWNELYEKATELFYTTDAAFNHSICHQLVKDTLHKANKTREFLSLPLACQRSTQNPEYVQWTATATILGQLADPKYTGSNFDFRAQHCCTRLLEDAVSRQIIGAELTELRTNKLVIAKAKKYVICAGAVLTAGILFNSGIRPNTYPALGRYMTEQTMAVCQVVIKTSLVESVWDDPRCKEHFRKFPHDPLHIPFNDPDPQITAPLSKEYPWHTQIQRDPFHYNAIPHSVDPRRIIDLRSFGYMKPVYGNCVQFSSEVTDPFGMPQPTFHYRLDKEDAERAQAMMKDMISLASNLGEFLPGGEPKFLAAGAALHICGTTRAGKADDGQSVVDKHSKVWRLDDVFIGGCGVIPTQNACNPTLTAACFAIASARKIVEDILALKRQHGLS